MAALCEDTVFRGTCSPRLADVLGRGRLETVVAVLGSSLVFGLLHSEHGVVAVVAATSAGAVLSVLRYRRRSLWAPPSR